MDVLLLFPNSLPKNLGAAYTHANAVGTQKVKNETQNTCETSRLGKS
jgi:hypothetical protein